MSVLSKEGIVSRLQAKDPRNRLVVTPLLDEEQIGPSSIDLRLGPEIIVLDRSRVDIIDLSEPRKLRDALRNHARRIYVGYRKDFVLHPGEFVLASTLEYIALPGNLVASVVGRSSLGRTGLIIATATTVHPGFHGCITLEVENLGSVPIRVFPGVRIGQLVLFDANAAADYLGKYTCPTGPELGKLDADKDLIVFAPKGPRT